MVLAPVRAISPARPWWHKTALSVASVSWISCPIPAFCQLLSKAREWLKGDTKFHLTLSLLLPQVSNFLAKWSIFTAYLFVYCVATLLRYNSQTYKSPVWSVQFSGFKSTHRVVQPLSPSVSEHFITPQRVDSLAVTAHLPRTPQPWSTSSQLPSSVNPPILCISHKWNHAVYSPFWLASSP